MMLFNRAWLVVVMLLSIVALPIRAGATSPTVIFSEIAWAGSSISSSDEWIELTNLTSETIDVSGWTITGAGSSGKKLTLPTSSSMAPYSTFLITNYEHGNKNTVLASAPNYTTSTVSLPNDGFALTLFDALGTTIDTAGGSGAPFAGGSGATATSADGRYRSMVRIDGLMAGSEKTAWTDATSSSGFLEGVTDLGTPGVVEPVEQVVIVENVETAEVAEAEVTETPVQEEVVVVVVPIAVEEVSVAQTVEETVEVIVDEIQSAPSVLSDPEVLAQDPIIEETIQADVVEETTENEVDKVDEVEEVEEEVKIETVLTEPLVSYTPGVILINEFVVDPLDTQTEWIELVNRSGETITPTNWTIEDAAGKTTDLSNLILAPGSFAIVDAPKGKLNNDRDTITLRDATHLIIDSVSYGGSLPSPQDGMALARNSSDEFVLTETTTPGTVNVIFVEQAVEAIKAAETKEESVEKDASVSSDQDAANEVQTYTGPTTLGFSSLYPNTTGSDETEEYIELTNTGTESIDLLGWSIEDSTLDRYTGSESQIVEPGAHVKIGRIDSGITLNNTGDTLELRDPNNEVVDTVSYGNAAKGAAYTLEDDAWSWSGTVSVAEAIAATMAVSTTRTISSASSSSTSSRTQTMTIEESKNLSDGKRVRVEGIVTALPGVFARQTLYVMDETGGIQIYFYDADFPELVIGQRISLIGEMSTSHGERRIKIHTQEDVVTTEQTATNTPILLSIPEIGDDQVGLLITTKGLVQSRESGKLLIEDSGSELVVSLKSNPEIDAARFERGDHITITGVLTSYDGEHRIRPRTEEDIMIDESVETLALSTDEDGKSLFEDAQARTGMILLLVTAASLGLLAFRQRRIRQLTLSTP